MALGYNGGLISATVNTPDKNPGPLVSISSAVGDAWAGPVVEEITTTANSSTFTSHDFAYPTTVNANDLLVLVISSIRADPDQETANTIAAGESWTEISVDQTSASGNFNHPSFNLGVFAKVADGTEGGTTGNMVLDLTAQLTCHMYRIRQGTYRGGTTAAVTAPNANINLKRNPRYTRIAINAKNMASTASCFSSSPIFGPTMSSLRTVKGLSFIFWFRFSFIQSDIPTLTII